MTGARHLVMARILVYEGHEDWVRAMHQLRKTELKLTHGSVKEIYVKIQDGAFNFDLSRADSPVQGVLL